jgi:NhaP-type Na+/H+ or K+/H+ antiporter
MTNIDVVKILQMGIIGLGFLLALLAFWLLRNEQHKQTPSGLMLIAIYVFMFFSCALCVFGLVPEVIKLFRSEDQKDLEIKKLTGELDSVTNKLSKTCEAIRTTGWLDKMPDGRKALSKDCH